MNTRIHCVITIVFIVFSAVQTSMPYANTFTALEQLRWKHRLIVAIEQQPSGDELKIRQWVDKNTCQLEQRDVAFIFITDAKAVELTQLGIALDVASTQALIKRLGHNTDDTSSPTGLLLIGKDGGVKASSSELKSLNAFLDQIDTMPMRRSEALKQEGMCFSK